MINFRFSIRNPYSDRFKIIWHRACSTPIKFKFIEFQLSKTTELVEVRFDVTTKESHAGAQLELALLGYSFEINFYDQRHWDYEHNCWHNN